MYNLSPDRLEFELKHQSVQLEKGFEVEGFSVNGKVTNIVGASVIVNGEVRAKSGTNGEFTISKMKPGTYDFEVTAGNKLNLQPLQQFASLSIILASFYKHNDIFLS